HCPVQIVRRGNINNNAFGLAPLRNLSANLRHIHDSVAVQQGTEPYIRYRPPGILVAENTDRFSQPLQAADDLLRELPRRCGLMEHGEDLGCLPGSRLEEPPPQAAGVAL